jgi:hypothetical protein
MMILDKKRQENLKTHNLGVEIKDLRWYTLVLLVFFGRWFGFE